MTQFAVAAMGDDRPGIVADMTEALLEAGMSVDDSSMTILGGHFAMLLVVEGEGDRAGLHASLEPVAERHGMLLEVRDAAEHPFSDEDRDDYVVAAYGPDRPGLVSALSRLLADREVNITDFGSRLGANGTFAMWFNVTLPAALDAELLASDLRDAGGELGLDVRVHRAEAEEL